MPTIESDVDPRVLVGLMLVEMGVMAYEKFKTYLSENTDDDAILASIIAKCDERIARRG